MEQLKEFKDSYNRFLQYWTDNGAEGMQDWKLRECLKEFLKKYELYIHAFIRGGDHHYTCSIVDFNVNKHVGLEKCGANIREAEEKAIYAAFERLEKHLQDPEKNLKLYR